MMISQVTQAFRNSLFCCSHLRERALHSSVDFAITAIDVLHPSLLLDQWFRALALYCIVHWHIKQVIPFGHKVQHSPQCQTAVSWTWVLGHRKWVKLKCSGNIEVWETNFHRLWLTSTQSNSFHTLTTGMTDLQFL